MRAGVCSAIGCRAPRVAELTFCREHWRKVPKPIRDQVARQYRIGQTSDRRLISWQYRAWAGRARQALAQTECAA